MRLLPIGLCLNPEEVMNERGSFSLEMSIILSIILIVLGLVILRLGSAFERVAAWVDDPECYEEAFEAKIEAIRIEKIMKEKR